MGDYHSREAWQKRIELRFRKPVPPGPLLVYYHAALMTGWRSIVLEQFDLLRFCGLTELHASCLGSEGDIAAFRQMAAESGIALNLEYTSPNFEEFEHPALCRVWRAACASPASAILYLHTKGVSRPEDLRLRHWRRTMQKYVVADWRANLAMLATYDLVGANWQELPQFSHFQGNFWMARADWLSHLDDPSEYREKGQHIRLVSQPWNRMHAETWVGSQPRPQVRALVGTNLDWWRGTSDLDGIDIEIEGFDYSRYGS